MRKRLLLFVLMISCFVVIWADEVTEKEAQQVAQQFVMSRQNRKSPPKVESAGQVSGLYVFNVSNNGGFVIVSNDDRTTPILGFGESGNIDTEKMPDNMRAWLQGYADEIAWVQKNVTKSSSTSKARTRTGSHSTATIGPLVSTTWDQNYPYNAFCPDGSATGCVATAMAQVMYYTETKAGNNTTTTTAEIPSYKTRNGIYELPAIAAGSTINWSNMKEDYSKSYTSEQATAVAYLMLYCGYAVKMNYGPSSGAYTTDVDNALKNYFGYAETTQYVNRNCYSYANWTDLIYNELSQGRPVIYAGESVDVGHEFVCDGYECKEGNDLFHINWGWGGTSDGYFVLSVLNPDEQGIGGSPTSSAYTYGQEAIIGIQKIGGEGTVLNVPVNEINLTINYITLTHSTIALGESVDVTVNVTNNSENNAYDGEITLTGVGGGKVFVIPAKGTQDCIITVTPSTAKTYTVKAKHPTGSTTYTQSTCYATLTVKNQTPTDLTASSITTSSATIGWTNVGEATKWSLRSIPVNITTEDFNGNETTWTKQGWTIDANSGLDGSPCVKSEYDNKRHWLVSPEITFGGNFSFYAWKSGETDEKFSVLFSTDFNTFYYIQTNIAATDSPTKYTVDLSDFSGQGWVAIIHTTASGSPLFVDNLTLAQTGSSWTKVDGITSNSYNLTGLSATTNYEVQVQAVINDGGKWSDSFIFTTTLITLAEASNNRTTITNNDGIMANITLSGRTLYKDGYWNTLCLPFNMTAAQVTAQLAPSALMTLSSSSFADGTLTLDFEDAQTIEAGKPYIIKWANNGDHLINPTLTGVTLNNTSANVATDYATFTGCFSPVTLSANDKSVLYLGADNNLYYPGTAMTINACRAYFVLPNSITAGNAISQTRTIVMNYGNDGTTSIISINNQMEEKEANELWFDLSGRRLSGKPTTKGLYINNGIKVVIK